METVSGITDRLLHVNLTTQPSNAFTEQANSRGCLELSPSSLNPCDHEDSLVSRATRLVIDDVIYVGLLPCLTVVGVVVNVINMAVFTTQGLGDRVHLCLFSLSLADLLALTSMAVRYMSKTLTYVISPAWAYNVWLTSLIRYRLLYVSAGFLLVTNLISIVIAVDRWVCVTWPLRAARLPSARQTGLVILVVSFLVFGGNQFLAFKYDVTCAYVRGVKTRPLLYAIPSKLYQDNPILMDTLDAFVFSSLVPSLSLILTTAATSLTALKLKRATTWRNDAARGGGTDVINRKEKAVTYMLIIISCVYIACVSPRVLRAWCRFFIPEFRAWGKWCSLVLVTEAVMNALLCVNSAINFFVYYTMGSRFRATLHQLMTRSRSKLSGSQNSSVAGTRQTKITQNDE